MPKRFKNLHTAGTGLWAMLAPAALRLRREATPAENLLWQVVRGRRLGSKFRRQHVIDRFIVDFYCAQRQLVIEIDGPYHEKEQAKDEERDARLTALGFTVLRISNQRIETEIKAVVEEIKAALV